MTYCIAQETQLNILYWPKWGNHLKKKGDLYGYNQTI